MARTKGAIGKKKADLLDQIERKSKRYWHPVLFLAEIAQSETYEIVNEEGERITIPVDLDVRIDCAKEVARYVAPRLKPVDLEHHTDKSKPFMVRWEDSTEQVENIIDKDKSIINGESINKIDNEETSQKQPKVGRRDRMNIKELRAKAGIGADEVPQRRMFRHIDAPFSPPGRSDINKKTG